MAKKYAPQHFHKYEKHSWDTGTVFYKCMLPGCAHYLPHAILAVGRESLCWGKLENGQDCMHLVIITKEDVQRNGGLLHPMCEICRTARKERREELRRIV
jgi:hypothetical protein